MPQRQHKHNTENGERTVSKIFGHMVKIVQERYSHNNEMHRTIPCLD